MFSVHPNCSCLFSVPQVVQMKEDLEKVMHTDSVKASTKHQCGVKNADWTGILVWL